MNTSIKFIFIFLFSLKIFAIGNDFPRELKVAIQWRHIPHFAFLDKFVGKYASGGSPLMNERFELTLFRRVSHSMNPRLGKAIGRPIATAKSLHYDWARIRLVHVEEDNLSQMGEEEKRRKAKGKMGVPENQQNDGFELQIKMILGGTWNNQIIIKRLETLPLESQILKCPFDVDLNNCETAQYNALEYVQPQRQIFFEFNWQSPGLSLEKIECTRRLIKEELQFQKHRHGIEYSGPVCPSDAYSLHLNFNSYSISLNYNCDEAIYEDAAAKNVYQFKNHRDGTLECKLKIEDLGEAESQRLAVEIKENEWLIQQMERQMQQKLWELFYKQIETLEKYKQFEEGKEKIISHSKNVPQEEKSKIVKELIRVKPMHMERLSMLPTLSKIVENLQKFFMKISPPPSHYAQNALTATHQDADIPAQSKDPEDNLLSLTLGRHSPKSSKDNGKRAAIEVGQSSSSSSAPTNELINFLMPKTKFVSADKEEEDEEPSMSLADLLSLSDEAKNKRIRYLFGKFMKISNNGPPIPFQPPTFLLDQQISSAENASGLTEIMKKALLSGIQIPHHQMHAQRGNSALNTDIGHADLLHSYQMLSQPQIFGQNLLHLKHLKEAHRQLSQSLPTYTEGQDGSLPLKHVRKLTPRRPETLIVHKQTLKLIPDEVGRMEKERAQQEQESTANANHPIPVLRLHLGLSESSNIQKQGKHPATQSNENISRPPTLQIQQHRDPHKMAKKFLKMHNNQGDGSSQKHGLGHFDELPYKDHVALEYSKIPIEQIHQIQDAPKATSAKKSSALKSPHNLQFQLSDFLLPETQSGTSGAHHLRLQSQHSDFTLRGLQRQLTDSVKNQQAIPHELLPSEITQNTSDDPTAFYSRPQYLQNNDKFAQNSQMGGQEHPQKRGNEGNGGEGKGKNEGDFLKQSKRAKKDKRDEGSG